MKNSGVGPTFLALVVKRMDPKFKSQTKVAKDKERFKAWRLCFNVYA